MQEEYLYSQTISGMSRERKRIQNPDGDESILRNVFPPCEETSARRLTINSANVEGGTSGMEFGIINVSGEASLHQGDNIGVHHHYYETAQPLQKSFIDSAAYVKLLESLSFERMDTRLRNVTTALSNTCTWIFDHEKFVSWSDETKRFQHNGFLWIKGKPGCGKSTIMKSTLNWSRKNWPDEWVIVSYFFNARAPSAFEKSSLGLYQSVTHQLLSALSGFEKPFLKSFSFKIRDDTVEEWSVAELQEFLVEIAQSTQRPPLCLFIDALDEGEEDDVRSMIDFLEELSSQAASSCQSLRVCLSSRHYPNITIGQALYLTIEHEHGHDRDVEIYVDKKLKALGHQGMGDLREQLIRKSEKIFLWVVVVVPLLNKAYDRGRGPKAMDTLLREIPKGLNGLFSDILSKSVDCFEECEILLRWVLFSFEPLSPQELYLAILYTKYTKSEVDFHEEEEAVFDSSRVQRCILDWSRGLVEFTKGAKVQFIHETVRDYLLFSKEASQIVSVLSSNVQGASHETMKNACIRYLASKQHQLQQVKAFLTSDGKMAYATQKSPFMDYSVHSLFHHADKAQQHGVSQRSFVLRQMQRERAGPVDWYAAFKSTAYRPCDNNLLRPIADNNLQYLAQVLVKESVDFRLIEFQSKTASLRIACERGYEQVARCLIECGAYDSSVYGTVTDVVFLAACAGGSLEIVRLLLDRGADVNAREGSDGNALQVACFGGYLAVTKLLLDRGADTDAAGCHALQAACLCGHLAIAKLLLDRRANINACGGSYGSALCAASYGGRSKVVELLVDRGADVNLCGFHGPYANAVAAACGGGELAVVKFLLDRGADINAYGRKCRNALISACAHGHLEIVELLLDRQADINAVAGGPMTALIAAVSAPVIVTDRERVIRLLIDRGADVRARTSTGHTALYKAAQYGHSQIVQMLLDAGAEDPPDKSCDNVEVRKALESVQAVLATLKNDLNFFFGWFNFQDIIKILEQKLNRDLPSNVMTKNPDRKGPSLIKRIQETKTVIHLRVYQADRRSAFYPYLVGILFSLSIVVAFQFRASTETSATPSFLNK